MVEPPLFSPVTTARVSEDIVLQIEAAILNGRLMPDDRLPSEREMQKRFGTGRGVIREALQALKQKGLVEIRKGARGGAYIKQAEIFTASEALALFLRQQEVGPELLIEFRESMDRTIAVLAISRGDAGAKEELVVLADSFADSACTAAPDMQALSETDRLLNIKLCRMAKNPIFEWIMQALQHGFSSCDNRLYATAEYREATARNWQSTARKIAAGEPAEALACISHHYYLLRQRLVQKSSPHTLPSTFLSTTGDRHEHETV